MAAKRILLPIDGSATAEAAARFAEDIARAEGSEVIVVGVVVPIDADEAEGARVTAAVQRYMTETVAAEAQRIRAAGIATEEVVTAGSPVHQAILDVAGEREIDVIVMGTHGNTGLARAVIGSVADRVVRHSTVPVVLVPMRTED